jgi:hypothetical protein
MAIKVVHIKDDPKREGEYIGRGYAGRKASPLGNPYSHIPNARATYVESREEAVYKFAKWLQIRLGLKTDSHKDVADEMNRLYLIAKKGDLTLVCHCKPKLCHGEVIKAVLDAKLADPKAKTWTVIKQWYKDVLGVTDVPAFGNQKVS